MKKHYQNIVIGAGSGGMTAAIGLSALGKEVALIEGLHVGGDCTNVGCVPSKTLIHLAKNFKEGTNPDEVLRETIRKRDALRNLETEEVQEIENLTFIEGMAQFTAPKTLEITNSAGETQQITAENIVISTGARPRRLDIPGLPAERSMTNIELFDLENAPKHIAIIGAGVIALEMAFALQKIGTKVTMLALDKRALITSISEAAEAIQASLDHKGIATYYGATAKSYDEATQTLTLTQGDAEIAVNDVDKVLVAIGRIRNINALGLEQAGVKSDSRMGITINAFCETNVKGVYAIGDVTPTSAFTHSANAQGRRVVQRIAFPLLPMSKKEPIFPSATFSDPEVATVGLTAAELSASCHKNAVKRIRVDLKGNTDRAYTDGIEEGFIIVDAVRLTGRILHATIVAPHASEMISFFTLAISQKISLYKIYRLVYPYPTFSSGILKVADFFMSETLTNLSKEIGAYLRYRFVKPKNN